jgi:phospholipase/lecithinase/hemolysin
MFVTNKHNRHMRALTRSIFLIVTFLTHAQFCFGTPQNLDRFDKVIVFGDGLSDNGNSFVQDGTPPPPYFEGRWSNGFNWVDYFPRAAHHFPRITAFLQDGGTNFAVGSATSADLSTQIGTFLANFEASSHYLYVVWIGSNDFAAGINPQTTVQNISSGIVQLATAGARDIVVVDLPDISITPNVIARGGQIVQEAKQFVTATDSQLALQVYQAATFYPIRVGFVDINSLFVPLVMDPTAFGLKNSVQAAFDPSTGKIVSHPNEFVFWDGFHPTTPVHLKAAQFLFLSIGAQMLGSQDEPLAKKIRQFVGEGDGTRYRDLGQYVLPRRCCRISPAAIAGVLCMTMETIEQLGRSQILYRTGGRSLNE